ncbi:MAG: DNA polymerase III subunit delta [Gammaproteobacteria bacterium]|nr:DNA polymerase III subunit delta [Gammaproteobacteria bacterium]
MIDSQQFNQHIINSATPTFESTYLFYGQTPFLSEENADVLIQSAKCNGFPQREIFYIDNRFKFQSIHTTLQSPGLFDPKQIIELRFDNDKPTKKIGEHVVEIAKHASNNIVIIQASSVGYRAQKEKWFTELIQHSTPVISKPIYPNQLPNWVNQRAQLLQLQLSSDALKTIIKFSEGNLLWTSQILMQLSHSDYPQPIQGDVVEAMLTDMSVFKIDDLNRALLAKQSHVLKIAQKLQQENESLVYITSSIYRELDTLNHIMQSGQTFAQACKELRIWQSKQKTYQAAINHFSPQKIHNALRDLALLDKINKGQHKGDGWLLLHKIISALVVH